MNGPQWGLAQAGRYDIYPQIRLQQSAKRRLPRFYIGSRAASGIVLACILRGTLSFGYDVQGNTRAQHQYGDGSDWQYGRTSAGKISVAICRVRLIGTTTGGTVFRIIFAGVARISSVTGIACVTRAPSVATGVTGITRIVLGQQTICFRQLAIRLTPFREVHSRTCGMLSAFKEVPKL